MSIWCDWISATTADPYRDCPTEVGRQRPPLELEVPVSWPYISGSGRRARLSPSAITGSKHTLSRRQHLLFRPRAPCRGIPSGHSEVNEISIFSGFIWTEARPMRMSSGIRPKPATRLSGCC